MFETTDALIMSAAYAFRGNSFVSEKPRPWSPKPLANLVNSVRNFDLARDGKRIAALMPAETPEENGSQSRVMFLLNFFDELERRVPAKK